MRAALALLAALGLAACSANEPRLTRIVISPEVPVVARGASIHFVAAGLYSDGAVRDITAEVAWTVSDRVVAEADEGAAPGAVRGLMPGMLWMPQDRPYSDQTIVDNVVGQAGKKFLLVRTQYSSETEGAQIAFDITGPWR